MTVVTLSWSAVAQAQSVRLRSEQAPYYAGVPFDLQVVAEGFAEQPTPEIHYQAPPGSTLEVRAVNPKVSSFMQIVNGRITRSKQVQFVFDLRFMARVPGHYSVGPFRVVQGELERSTAAYDVQLSEIPVSGSQRIRLVLPEGPVYVGQRVRVRVQWWTDATMADQLVNQRAIVPLFDRTDAFSFFDTPDPKAKFAMLFELQGGDRELPATVQQRREKEGTFVVRTAERVMVPLEAGRFELQPSTLIVDEAVSWRRDFFGMRTPTRIRTLRAIDDPRVLEVLDLPAEGRPASFAGAVGSGFSLQARADRTVVRVGDPIKLTLTLRGDGALDTASLPRLDRAGLGPGSFRVPAAQAAAGVYEDGAKRFEVVVRAIDAGVEAIPPIAFSWFDPALGGYQTTTSEPIALSVSEAPLVSAADVYRAEKPAPAEPPGSAPPAGRVRAERTAEREATAATGQATFDAAGRDRSVLTGADLSIVTDVDRLMETRSDWLTRTPAQAALYAAGLLSLALAGVLRRRSRVDPALRARRSVLAGVDRALRKATAPTEIAGLLRSLLPFAQGSDKTDLDELLARVEELAFRPGGEAFEAPEPLRRRARERVSIMLDGEPKR